MKRIDILGLHLNYGGTEQAIINQANMLCGSYDVNLVVTYKIAPAFKINEKVKVIYLTPYQPNREEFKKAIHDKNFIKIIREGIRAIKILHAKAKTMRDYIKTSNADIIISSRLSTHKIVKKYAPKSALRIGEEHRYSLNDTKYIHEIQKWCADFNYFICVSQELTNFYQKLLPHVNCVFIPNSLDDNTPQNIADYTSKNLLFIGRLSREKGLDDALKVMYILIQKDPNIKLNIVGEGPERTNLESQIKKYHLENNVILCGFQNQTTIKKIAAKSSLFLLTSREESFGTVIIEAASYGLPAIIFDSAKGPLEIVQNHLNGIIIPNRNIDTLASTILKLFANPQEIATLGEKAFLESQKYNFQTTRDKWLALLSLALEKNDNLL